MHYALCILCTILTMHDRAGKVASKALAALLPKAGPELWAAAGAGDLSTLEHWSQQGGLDALQWANEREHGWTPMMQV